MHIALIVRFLTKKIFFTIKVFLKTSLTNHTSLDIYQNYILHNNNTHQPQTYIEF